MKTTQIHLLRVSAIGLWLCAALFLLRFLVVREPEYEWNVLLEAYSYGHFFIEILSIAILCFTLYSLRQNMPKLNKTTRALLHIVAWFSVFSATIALVRSLPTMEFSLGIYPYPLASVFICVMVGIIVWIISSHIDNEPLPKCMAVALAGTGGICVWLLIMLIVATIYVFSCNYVFGFHSYVHINWLRTLAPVVFLPWYAIYNSISAKKSH